MHDPIPEEWEASYRLLREGDADGAEVPFSPPRLPNEMPRDFVLGFRVDAAMGRHEDVLFKANGQAGSMHRHIGVEWTDDEGTRWRRINGGEPEVVSTT